MGTAAKIWVGEQVSRLDISGKKRGDGMGWGLMQIRIIPNKEKKVKLVFSCLFPDKKRPFKGPTVHCIVGIRKVKAEDTFLK